ncbi:regulatory protein, TetR [Lunatimonas lonarensis]|uniref:Regulatory protein, TetR n=1 Tax=Lunatimonas lonarensis TaxID=1232681 RepID=R7ZY87_9BACT|nr:TetR/AcrR family transcriptional regulator [Lunatimonas lonarensis]EON79003.1 regulatory protein, TetR [Lunatimonas lonarensis]
MSNSSIDKKIISAAVTLFNEKGLIQTSFRDIGEALGISDGHVRYYFRTKEALLLAVFNQMDEEILSKVTLVEEHLGDLHARLKGQIEHVFGVMASYRFFFMESPKTLGQYPELIHAYARLMESRRQLFLMLFSELGKRGVFHVGFDGPTQERVFQTVFLVSEGWIRTHYLSKGTAPDRAAIDSVTTLLIGLIAPYIEE